jgi:hypothetical protein
MEMDNMKQIIQELLGGMEERMNASMEKLLEASTEKFEEKLDDYHKMMMAKWNTHRETTEIDPDPEMMQPAVEHQEFPM